MLQCGQPQVFAESIYFFDSTEFLPVFININNNNNNALPLQHIHPAQEVEFQHVANQVQPDAEPIAPQENAQPHPADAIQNRRPGWINRMAENIRNRRAQLAGGVAHVVNNLQNHPEYLANFYLNSIPFLSSVMLTRAQYGHDSREDHFHSAVKIYGITTLATGLFILGLDAVHRRLNSVPTGDAADVEAAEAMDNLLRSTELTGRSIDAVVREVRGFRTGPSSSTSTSFDWTQRGLFVDRNGIERTAEVSHLFNRILRLSLTDEQGNTSSARVALFNNLLDSLEQNPDHRSGFANQVLQINSTCIDRATMGFNVMLRQLGVHSRENISNRDFLLNVIRDAAFTAADNELIKYLQENRSTAAETEPQLEAYQAIYCLMAQKIREKIPDFPQVIEQLKYVNLTGLRDEEKDKIADAVVKKIDNPMQSAQLLYEFPKQNQAMEERFKEELKEIGSEFDKRLDEKCEELATSEGRELTLEEMGKITIALQPERQKAQTERYAQLIAEASLFKH